MVLLVLPTDSLSGGAETVLYNIARCYVERGEQVDVLFLTRKKHDDWGRLSMLSSLLKVQYTHASRELTGIFPLFWMLYKHQKHYSFVYSSHPQLISFLGLVRKMRVLSCSYLVAREKCSVFLRYRGVVLGLHRLYHLLGYRQVDLLICQTDTMKKQFLQGAPRLASKIRIETIHNPVNNVEMKQKSLSDDEFRWDSKLRYIVAAGRLVQEKGWDVLIKSFAQFYVSYPTSRLIILGEGPLRSDLEALISSHGLGGIIVLHGRVGNVYPYFKRAYMCVVSSRMEGFPNVLLQMMSQCDRVVSTLCAGDIDKIRGLVTCPPGDVQAIQEAMEYAMAMSTEGIRTAFDQELESRSIEHFIEQCEQYCHE